MAKIRTAHGVRGLVKLECFAEDPAQLPSYNPLTDDTGREFNIVRLQPHKKYWLTEIEGVKDREEAEALRNTSLYIARDRLPDINEDDTFYHLDLIGLTAFENGKAVGIIKSIQNFGSGDLLEIKPDGEDGFFLPFIDEFVPEIDLKAGTVTITPPEGLR